VELVPGFRPETELERALIEDPEVRAGLAWGNPRRGHPEGAVGEHVADLLARIDRWGVIGKRRSELRFISLIHDTLKFRVSPWLLRTGENHHAVRARHHAERYVSDERVLAVIELHDRPYTLWRKMKRWRHLDERGFQTMVRRLPDPDLFMHFVRVDGSTEGKSQEPIAWLEGELRRPGSWGSSSDGEAELLRRSGPAGVGLLALGRLAEPPAGPVEARSCALAAAGRLRRQPPGRGGGDRHRAGRSARDDAADRSTRGVPIAGASQLRLALRSGSRRARPSRTRAYGGC
jgi:hypothetical protein